MALTVQFNPQPYGNVTVATPGTPVQLAVNLPNLSPAVTAAVTDQIPCNKILFVASGITQTGAGNTGNVYIGQKNMVRATLAGVVAVIPPGGAWQITNNVGLNIYPFEKFYMDADNAGDGVYGSFDTV